MLSVRAGGVVVRPTTIHTTRPPRRHAAVPAGQRVLRSRLGLEWARAERRRGEEGRCAASEMDEAAPAPEVVIPFPRERVQCGSVIGAAALIAGSAIGGGILALPAATAQIGLLPATSSLVAVWAYSCAQV
jgi:hypothetical protein